MKPPICAVCNMRFSPADGGLVKFANYEPLPKGRVGHPRGLVWFCSDHIAAARNMSGRTSREALEMIGK